MDIANWIRNSPQGLNHSQGSRQMRKFGSGKGALPEGRPGQLIVQCLRVSPESTHTGNVIQTKQVIVRNICVIYMCIIYIYIHINICML